jgi:hypothetical protein
MHNPPVDLATWIYETTFQAAVNQIYNQKMEWYWSVADSALLLLAGVLAGLGVLAASNRKWSKWGVTISIAALIGTWVCLVIPTGAYKHEYGTLHQQWSDVRQSLEDLSHQFEGLDRPADPPEYVLDAERQIKGRINAIESTEGAPWHSVLVSSTEDWTEHLYGKGIRTPEQVEEFQKARRANGNDAPPAVSLSGHRQPAS